MFTVAYCIDDEIIITPDSTCPDCGNKIDECICSKCPDCGNKVSECICGEKCPVCGNKVSECTCEKCSVCGNKVSECTCPKPGPDPDENYCQVCGKLIDECTCNEPEPEPEPVCPNTPECNIVTCKDCGATYCSTHRTHECEEPDPEPVCPNTPECNIVTCKDCGATYCSTHRTHECEEPDPEPVCPNTPECDVQTCSCGVKYCIVHELHECEEPDPEPVPPPIPPVDPDDPEANYHRFTLEVPLSKTDLKVKTAQYTNYIGNNVEIEQAIYNEETGTTEISDDKRSYRAVAYPDVTDLYKNYYTYYNDYLVTNEDIDIKDVDQKYQKIYVDLNRQLEADFSTDPYWKLSELQVKANTGNEPPYDVNDFTFDKSISISETCLNPEAFEEFEPDSKTLNYVSIRTSEDTIYITYATPWEKGLGDE